MAAVSSEIATAILELRSAALTLIAVVLKITDLDILAAELEQRASVMPGLFDDEPVAIDLSRVRDLDEPVAFDELIALLRRHRMVPLAVRCPSRALAELVGQEVEALYLNGPAGGGGVTQSVREVIAAASALIPREAVRPRCTVLESGR
jgi:septum formation inhibitor MinC